MDLNFYESITKLINSPTKDIPTVCVSDLFAIHNFKGAFRKNIPNLYNFLNSRVSDVLDIAFGDSDNQSCAMFALTQSSTFSLLLLNNPNFLKMIEDFVSSMNIESNENDNTGEHQKIKAVVNFSIILNHNISQTNGILLSKIQNKKEIFQFFVDHICIFTAFEVLELITTKNSPDFINFLKDSNSTSILFERCGPSRDISRLLLNIIQNSSNDSEYFLDFYFNTININKLYDSAVRCRNYYSFKVLQYLVENGYDSDFLEFLENKKGEISDFICENSTIFDCAKSNALTLIVDLINLETTIDDTIIKIANTLFKRFFEYDYNTNLHKSFYNFLRSVVTIAPSILETMKVRERIIERYSHRSELNVTYWGFLHKISGVIYRYSNILPPLDEWNSFLDSHFLKTQKILSAEYGGHLQVGTKLVLSDSFSLFFPLSKQGNEKKRHSSNLSLNDDSELEEEEGKAEIENSFSKLICFDSIKTTIKVNQLNKIKNINPIPKFVRFSQNDKYIGILTDFSIEIYNISDFLKQFKQETDDKKLLSFSFYEKDTNIALCFEDSIQITDILDNSTKLKTNFEKINFVSFYSKDCSRILFLRDNETEVLQFPSLNEICAIKIANSRPTIGAFSTDANYAAVGYEGGYIIVYDITANSILKKLDGHNSSITCLLCRDEEEDVLSVSEENTVKGWTLNNDIPVIFEGHAKKINTIDAKKVWMLSGSDDKKVNITNLKTAEMIFSLDVHSDCITNVVYNNVGNMFATASRDGSVIIWNLNTINC